MAATNSHKIVYVALAGNFLIAIAKFTAAPCRDECEKTIGAASP